jgi:signal transduction histidine kinase/DNA-binding response OmpR family regulator
MTDLGRVLLVEENRVLLVEDNDDHADLVRVMLAQSRDHAWSIDRVASLGEAEARLAGPSPYDVVLLDLGLPDSQGTGGISSLRSALAAPAIVILTSSTDEEVATSALRLGAEDYLVKDDLEPRALARALRYAIARRLQFLEQQRVRERLARSERSLAEAQEVGHIGSWEWDIIAGTVTWSKEHYRLFGLPGREGPLSFDEALMCVHPDDRGPLLASFEATIRDQGEYGSHFRLILPGGSIRVIQSRGRIVLDGAGRIARMVGVAQDVTELREAEAERARLLEREREARAEAQHAADQLRSIQSVSDALLARLPMDDLLPAVLSRVREVLRAEVAVLWMSSADGERLVLRAALGTAIKEASIRLGEGFAGYVGLHRRTVSTDDDPAISLVPALRANIKSAIGSPLLVEGQLLGVICIGSDSGRAFTTADRTLLELMADRIAPALDRARLLQEAIASRQALQALSQRLVDAQESERSEIARELHDEAGQLLAGLKLLLESHDMAEEGARVSGAWDLCRQELRSIVDELLARIRDLSIRLRPPMLDDLGLVATLKWHVGRYSTLTGVAVDLRCEAGAERSFGGRAELAAYRVVQEALTNVARHSGAEAATVEVRVEGGTLHLRVSDRGRGFAADDAGRGSSLGLLGMRERCSALGGRFILTSEPGGGAVVAAELPFDPGRTGNP